MHFTINIGMRLCKFQMRLLKSMGCGCLKTQPHPMMRLLNFWDAVTDIYFDDIDGVACTKK